MLRVILGLALFAAIFAWPAYWTPALAVDCVRGKGSIVCQPGSDERAAQLIQASHAASQSVRNALTARFFGGTGGTGVVEVLGYAAESDDGTQGAFHGFTEQTAAVPLNTLWGDAAGYYSDRNSAIAGFEGTLVQGSIGFDHQVMPGTVLGLYGLVNSSHYTTQSASGAGTTDSDGRGVGIYGGQMIGDVAFADAMVSYTHADNAFTVGGSSANYGSQVLGLSAGLTGLFQFDQIRFSPRANVTYASEWRDGYTETSGAVSPARRTETGVATLGFQTGHTFRMDDNRTIEPWAGADLAWTYLDTTTPAPATPSDPVNALDLRLTGGINAALSDTVALALRAELGGLTTPDYIVGGAGAQLSGRF